MSDTMTPPAAEGKKSNFILIFTWIVLMGIVGYLVLERLMPQAQAENQSLVEILQTQGKQAESIEQITKILSVYDSQFKQIADHDVQIVSSLKQLDQAVNAGNSAWNLMQIQRYIEQAVVQADLMNNPDSAAQLLDIADMQVQRMNNPNFLPLRQALAKDKQMLTTGVSTTRENVVLALNAVIETIPTLKQRTQLLEPIEQNPATDNAAETWKDHLKRSLSELRSLIVVRHHEDSIPAYFSPNEAEIVNENLQLMLLQSAYAASLGRQGLFENNLDMAIAWFNRYYDLNSPLGANVLASLKKIKTQTIAEQKLTQFASIAAWNQILRSTGLSKSPKISEPEPTPEPAPAEKKPGGL